MYLVYHQNDAILAKLTAHWRAVKGVAHFEINLNLIELILRVLTWEPGSSLPIFLKNTRKVYHRANRRPFTENDNRPTRSNSKSVSFY